MAPESSYTEGIAVRRALPACHKAVRNEYPPSSTQEVESMPPLAHNPNSCSIVKGCGAKLYIKCQASCSQARVSGFQLLEASITNRSVPQSANRLQTRSAKASDVEQIYAGTRRRASRRKFGRYRACILNRWRWCPEGLHALWPFSWSMLPPETRWAGSAYIIVSMHRSGMLSLEAHSMAGWVLDQYE